MPKLTVLPSGNVIDVPIDRPIFVVLTDAGLAVASACGGKARCGLCRITVVDGWEALSSPQDVEEMHMGNLMHVARTRLSCQARLTGDVTIRIPNFEGKEDRMRRKANARRLATERADARKAPPDNRGPRPGTDPRAQQRQGRGNRER